MKILTIPTFKNEVAPSFDYASLFNLFKLGHQKIIRHDSLHFDEENSQARVHHLQGLKTEIVICNGIRSHSVRLLQYHQIQVITGLSGEIEIAIQRFLKGEFEDINIDINQIALQKQQEVGNFVDWSKTIFKQMGYSVSLPKASETFFPIDFIGAKVCPVCEKPIKVAVCCGNHLYKKEVELKEFVSRTGENFDVKVYVHPAFPAIEKLCKKHHVQLVDAAQKNLKNNHQLYEKFYSHQTIMH
jgi:predicted Fe-Mo cluster-binding NifX family protein